MLSLESRANALCGIFYQFDMPLLADGGYLVDAHGMAEGVHGHASLHPATGTLVVASQVVLLVGEVPALGQLALACVLANLGVLGEPSLEGIGRESHGGTIHVDEHGVGTDVAEGVAGGDESKCLGEHLVVLLHAHEQQTHVEGVGAAHANHRLLGSRVSRHILLEAVDELANGRHEGGVDALVEVFLLIAREHGYSQGRKPLVAIYRLDKVYRFLIICHYLIYIYHPSIDQYHWFTGALASLGRSLVSRRGSLKMASPCLSLRSARATSVVIPSLQPFCFSTSMVASS